MGHIITTRRLAATAIFDLEDGYARALRIGEAHPRPLGAVTITVVGRMVAGQRQDLPEPLRLKTLRSPSGYQLFFGKCEGPDGGLRRLDLAPATYVVRVTSELYRAAERDDIAMPRPDAAYFFDLQPGVAYRFPRLVRPSLGPTLLRGSLHRTDGAPIAGARVELAGAPQVPDYATGDDGQWVLALPPELPTGAVGVRVALPGAAPVTLRAQVVRGQETSLPHTGLRGWVVDARGLGIRGATIRVAGRDGQSLSDDGGRWFYYFGLDQGAAWVDVTATLPDGRTLRADRQPVQPQAVTRVPTFRDAK